MSEFDDNRPGDHRIDREYEEAVFATIVNRVVRMDDGDGVVGSDEEDTAGAGADRQFIEWGKESDEGMAPGETMDQGCLRTIRRHFAGKRAKRLAKASVKYIAGAAAVLALFCLCVGLIFPDSTEASDPVVRKSILDFISRRTEYDIYMNLSYEGTDNQLLSVETGWIPEDLEQISYSKGDNVIDISYGQTEDGVPEELLRIQVCGITMIGVFGTEYEEVSVQGNLALLDEDEYTDSAGEITNRISLRWYDQESGFLIWIRALKMEKEDVLQLAEELGVEWEQGTWTVKETTGFGSMEGY